jgi:hypothetical protein
MSSDGLDTQIQIIAVIVTGAMFLVVLELVRRRRLVERYALLWMLAALGLVVLAVWRDLLDIAADMLGIADPPNALFIVAFGIAYVLLLHFSVATSRLSEETKILAQEVARLDAELRRERAASRNGDAPADGDTGAGDAQRRAPSSARTPDQ